MDLSPLEQLRNQLLTALGLVAVACSGRQTSDDEAANGASTTDDADDQDDASGDDASDEGSGSGSSSSSTTTETETGEPEDCTVTFYSMGNLDEFPDCMLPLTSEFGCPNPFYLACTALLGDQSCEQQCPDPGGVCAECADHSSIQSAFGVCGPYEIGAQCCSIVGLFDDCGGGIEGRPFVVDGVSRFAALEASEVAGEVPALPEAVRRHLADHWARVAAAEHASVASFACFALRLLALGVPPALVRDAFAAAQDEVRHAEAARQLASRFAGRALRFGPLDVRGAVEPTDDLESLVLACVREGCIGETLSALELATAASLCDDPSLAALLRSIADDEARHAALAWRFVQWAIARDPTLRPRVAELFASWSSVARDRAEPPERHLLRRFGCPTADDRRRIEREGLRELLRPCANALLATCSELAT